MLQNRYGTRTSISWLAFLTGLLPACVVIVAYIISAASDLIPRCIPMLAGCTSVSAAGRYGMAYFFFKAGMIPAAVLLAAFWLLSRRWLLLLGDRDGPMTRAIVITGCTSAAFLILYTVFLGSDGEFYRLMRRYGVNIHFSFGYLAQLMLLGRLRHLQQAAELNLPAYILNGKLTVLIAMLIIGIGSIPVSDIFTDDHQPRNIIEWNFVLLMVSYYFFAWRAWVLTDFHLVPGVGGAADR